MGNSLKWHVWRKAILILTKIFSLLFGFVLEYEKPYLPSCEKTLSKKKSPNPYQLPKHLYKFTTKTK